jgi:hypothetical protein
VGAHAAVAVTVEGRRVTATSAVALAGDEIDERRFLGLLQLNPLYAAARVVWRVTAVPGDSSESRLGKLRGV